MAVDCDVHGSVMWVLLYWSRSLFEFWSWFCSWDSSET